MLTFNTHKMKINHLKYILLFIISFTITSCDDKLDLKPSDSIDPEKAYRNVADLNQGLLGAYAVLDYSLITSSAITSDELRLPEENTVSNTDAHRWIYTAASGSVTSAYSEYYRSIDRANRVLARADDVETGNSEITLRNQYKGEALAIRAFSHFELLKGYAADYENGALGVAYMKVAEISFPARDPFESVIANIKADLIAAKALIPASFNDKTRITKIAVAAMQARLAVYEKNWSDAITYATEVINSVPLATKAQFPGIWTDANNNEVIFKLKRNVNGVADGSLIGSFFFRQSGSIVLYAPSFKLINTFDKVNDVRYNAYIRFDNTRGVGKSEYLVKKYIGGTASQPGLADIKVFRTGEMYLIRAEAKAESTTPDLIGAATDLNTLRAERITGYVNQTFANKSDLITAIFDERFKELFLEGHRFFDIKRRNLPVQRLPEDANNISGAVLLPTTQAQYNYPLPAIAISVNKNAKQNPEYDK